MSDLKERYTNRLIKEKSPYLLQHAHNPVDWYLWGEEAFVKARKDEKPIFLSIGYSTCHWCHVMEEESFSSPEVAGIMNKYFVSVKVDREERPDLDNIYMNAVVAMTGSGGWPLSVFLTPEGKPFYGGTYFPPRDRLGIAGFKTVLLSIADGWANCREELLRSGESITDRIRDSAKAKSKESFSLSEDTLKRAYEQFNSTFDSRHGGFGGTPKFPAGHSLAFLLRFWKRSKEPKALEMVEKTLISMANGGIYDYIGGGFHRYSTDAEWRLPHFEKMLYDQALLSKIYLEAYQATKREEYAQTAREVFEYVLRNMTSPEGGFYSGEDADSASPENPEEKKEGAFYLWSYDEIIKILGREKAEISGYHFGIKPGGNILKDPYGEFKGKNILYVAHNLEETASRFKRSPQEVESIIKESKDILFEARSRRLRPHLDDKVIVDWNGLMISSLAFGSRVLCEPRYREASERAAQFILKRLKDKKERLLHRYRDGEAAIEGMVEDHAFFIHGLVDLYEATFNPEYLFHAKRLMQEALELFWDEEYGGFFFTGKDSERLIVRQKEIYDGAIPSGNSVAALDLIRLGRIAMSEEFEDRAELLLKAFSSEISRIPSAFSQALCALDFLLGPSKEIVIAGDIEAEDTARMISAIYRRFMPNRVVVFRPASEKEAQDIIRLVAFIEIQLPIEGKSTAYICEDYVCDIPAISVKKMEEILDRG